MIRIDTNTKETKRHQKIPASAADQPQLESVTLMFQIRPLMHPHTSLAVPAQKCTP